MAAGSVLADGFGAAISVGPAAVGVIWVGLVTAGELGFAVVVAGVIEVGVAAAGVARRPAAGAAAVTLGSGGGRGMLAQFRAPVMKLFAEVVMPFQTSGPIAAKFSPIRSAVAYVPARTSGSTV